MSDQRQRQRRDNPPRRDPNRSFSGTVQSCASDEDPILRGVQLGYRLITEQVNRGRKLAKEARKQFGVSRGGDVREITDRALRFYGDLFTDAALFWFDATLSAVGQVDIFDTDDCDSELSTSTSNVPLDVKSVRPVRVSLSLNSGVQLTDHSDLHVYTMQTHDGIKPPLMGVSFKHKPEGTVLRIRVPDAQPSGVYHGVVSGARDPDIVLGTLTIEILT